MKMDKARYIQESEGCFCLAIYFSRPKVDLFFPIKQQQCAQSDESYACSKVQ
jgi:hypothetical protein